MKWTELIEDTAWVVEDLLTGDECLHFLDKAEQAGIHENRASGDERHRNSVTVPVDDEEMAVKVFERIKDHLPQEVIVDETCENLGLKHSRKDLYGRWKPYALNTRWRVACYPGEGHFGPHRDGCYIQDENHRSLITLNGYLTDRPAGYGGATRFVEDDLKIFLKDGIFTTPEDKVIHRVEADKKGKAVVFFHDLMHDGEPLKEGSPPKWLFRTDVMFERDPATAPQRSPEQIEARHILKQAEQAENDGDIPGAIRLYNRAYHLDPSLEEGSVLS